jgi:predicted phosphodiesterase
MIHIAIGDIHGRTSWKTIVEVTNADKYIFIGDYFDSKDAIPLADQISNFREILAFKRLHSNKVILLCGNHDFHYLRFAGEQYSGFQQGGSVAISEVLEDAMQDKSLQMAYEHFGYLFTHAGVTKTWLSKHGYSNGPVSEFINNLFFFQLSRFRFQPGENYSRTGDDVTQSPIWVRPPSLRKDALEGIIQVVGHTRQDHIIIEDQLILIDALASGEFLVIDNCEKPEVSINYLM